MLFEHVEQQARTTAQLLETVAHVCNAIVDAPSKQRRAVLTESVKHLKNAIQDVILNRQVDQHLAHILAKTVVLADTMQKEVAWRRDIKIKPYADQLIHLAVQKTAEKLADKNHNHTEDPVSLVDELRSFKEFIKITPWSNRDAESRDKAMKMKQRVIELLDRIAVKSEDKLDRTEPQLTVMSLTSQITNAKSHGQKQDVLKRIEDMLKSDLEKGEESSTSKTS